MDEKVKAYIEEKRAGLAKKTLKEKEAILLELGLYSIEKVYPDEKLPHQEYPYELYDSEKDNYYYEKKAILDVTDEEYAEILSFQPEKRVDDDDISHNAEKCLNIWGTVILILGIIGFLASVVIAGNEEEVMPVVIGVAALLSSIITRVTIKVFCNISARLRNIENTIGR